MMTMVGGVDVIDDDRDGDNGSSSDDGDDDLHENHNLTRT